MMRTDLAALLPALDGESQAAYAYRLLELRIVGLDLKPGQAITEGQLCAELGLGRTPVREALQRLVQVWLVRVLPRRGMIVTDIDLNEQMRVIEARRTIEHQVVRLATARATPAQRTAFAQFGQRFDALLVERDEMSLGRVDSEFNELTFEAAGNKFMTAALGAMHAVTRRYWYVQSLRADIYPTTVRLHAQLAHAIASGKEDEAAGLNDALLDFCEQYTRASLS
ncbi:MAG: GntR family transcriptional regulator [Pseudomonadota bacterium]